MSVGREEDSQSLLTRDKEVRFHDSNRKAEEKKR